MGEIKIGTMLYMQNSENHCIDEVVAENKLEWITKRDKRIIKKTLFVKGSSRKFNKTHVFIAEQKHYDRVERDSLLKKYGAKFSNVSLEGLRKIDETIREHQITVEEKQKLSFGSSHILDEE